MDSRNVDGRADIYSLGLTFYYLLTGHRPFSKPTIMEVLMAHRTEKPEPIGKFRPDMPLDLEAIVDKMTAKSVQRTLPNGEGSGREAAKMAGRVGKRSHVLANFGADGRGELGRNSPPLKTWRPGRRGTPNLNWRRWMTDHPALRSHPGPRRPEAKQWRPPKRFRRMAMARNARRWPSPLPHRRQRSLRRSRQRANPLPRNSYRPSRWRPRTATSQRRPASKPTCCRACWKKI